MRFCLRTGHAIASEVRRIVLQQLDLACTELTAVGDPESDAALHDARRRVKKIRAILCLVRPVLDKAFRADDAELRAVSRLLAPVADGQGVLVTLDQLAHRYRKILPRTTVAALREDLLARERRIDAQAEAGQVLERATRTLRSERMRVQHWQLRAEGFRAIAPGLRESVHRARAAMIAAWRHPTAAHHHAWRRHVKNHWFHVRLIAAQCGHHLNGYQRRLEALDGMLGEYHNLVLLREVLVTDSALSRRDTARCLRVIVRYQRALRRNAQLLGTRLYSEKPRRFVRRVKRFWCSSQPAAAVLVRRSAAS